MWKCLAVLCCLLLITTAYAQSLSLVKISLPQIEQFPLINFYMDVRDQGKFIYGLQAEDIQIIEDDRIFSPDKVIESRPGVQLVVAFNPGASFLIRDAQGFSRYDSVVTTLVNWARNRIGSTIDDLSILVSDGPERSHINNPLELFYSLAPYELESSRMEPSLDILYRAIEIAADTPPRDGMKRVLLFITAPVMGDREIGAQNIISQARQMNIQVFVWVIAPLGYDALESAKYLVDLTHQTEGELFVFTGLEPIPDLESYLEALRSIYYVEYRSQIQTGGTHQLAVEVTQLRSRSETIQYTIRLEPPRPLFLSPAVQINRQSNGYSNRRNDDLGQNFNPSTQEYQILVEFPDERQRSLTHSILYVDSIIADENLETPFDRFTWDLTEYTQNEQHILQVEVVDSFGLTGKSIEMPVMIEVENNPASPLVFITEYLPWIGAGVLFILGIVLAMVLILGGKIQPKSPFHIRPRKAGKPNIEAESREATSSAELKVDERRGIAWMPTWQRKQTQATQQATAFLTQLTAEIENISTPPFPIIENKIFIGCDPDMATLILNDPSVEALHACLERQDDGSFRLLDQESIAGSWVNYLLVPPEGIVLEHADVIHIGRVGFRFSLSQPKQLRKPTIRYLKDKS